MSIQGECAGSVPSGAFAGGVAEREAAHHDRWAEEICLDDLCVYAAFEGRVSPEYSFAIERLCTAPGQRVLVLGCGAGEEAVYLARRGLRVSALDVSAGMLRVVDRLARQYGVRDRVDLLHGDVHALPCGPERFDRIFGNAVLHHMDLDRALAECRRTLRAEGRGVFIEPLAYNPVINFYRHMAGALRTADEHPLRRGDLRLFQRHFARTRHSEFHLATLLIFCWFYLGERIHPSQDRYWKKIIREAPRYERAFGVLWAVDRFILRVLPPLRWLCWNTVIEVS